jgi:rhamnose utilization protein RhaD (predicted bifunctional aldolase and dehydrogenase)
VSKKLSFKHVRDRWENDAADKLSQLERLVYRSNKLGEDLTLTNTGGGNTSSKLIEKDPFTGQDVEVLWIKGSGGDLRTARPEGFSDEAALSRRS